MARHQAGQWNQNSQEQFENDQSTFRSRCPGSRVEYQAQVGGQVIEGINNLGGTEVPNTNDVNWLVGASYNAPLPGANGLRLVAGVQVSHTGSYLGLQAWDTVEHDSYTVGNAQIGVQGGQWELLLQVENFTDEKYYTDVNRFPNLHALDGGPNINIGTMGQPRLFAASLSYRF